MMSLKEKREENKHDEDWRRKGGKEERLGRKKLLITKLRKNQKEEKQEKIEMIVNEDEDGNGEV